MEELPNIGRVSIKFHTSATVCSSAPGSTISIEMKTETGGSEYKDLRSGKLVPSPPPITSGSEVFGVNLMFAEDFVGKTIDGVANVNSTREYNTCSDRGLCNHNTGDCRMFPRLQPRYFPWNWVFVILLSKTLSEDVLVFHESC